MKWISVDDRLPKKEGFYFTKFGDGFIGENWFLMFDDSKEPKWYHDECVLGGIKYWAETDFVQVVRCKDCVHYNNNRQLFDDDICEIMYYSDGIHRTVCERDYCSYGERKEVAG